MEIKVLLNKEANRSFSQ